MVTPLACFVLRENLSTTYFFDCVVVRRAWEMISQLIGVKTGDTFESVARLWLYNKKIWCHKYYYFSSLLESLEAKECYLCPDNSCLAGMKMLWQRVLLMLRCWKLLIPLKMAAGFDSVLASMEKMVWSKEQIMWRPLGASGAGHDSDGFRRSASVQFQTP
jgi:hypothetical protein